uniref:Uncharacterized protein n=1 Tax=Romanomermis culicivorax TaxID=13658 RepID=A0A915JPU8_ROMCU
MLDTRKLHRTFRQLRTITEYYSCKNSYKKVMVMSTEPFNNTVVCEEFGCKLLILDTLFEKRKRSLSQLNGVVLYYILYSGASSPSVPLTPVTPPTLGTEPNFCPS